MTFLNWRTDEKRQSVEKDFRIQNHLRKIETKVVRIKKLMRGLRKEILK